MVRDQGRSAVPGSNISNSHSLLSSEDNWTADPQFSVLHRNKRHKVNQAASNFHVHNLNLNHHQQTLVCQQTFCSSPTPFS